MIRGPVKILCVADEIDLLVYSPTLRDRFGDIDLILSAGDLPDEYLGFIASMLNKPLLSVSGNHDPEDKTPRDLAYGLGYHVSNAYTARTHLGRLGFKIKKEAGITVLGIPGSMLYNGGPHQYSDFSMTLKVLKLIPRLLLNRLFKGRGVDIILTHAPPKGIQDGTDRCHQGFQAFRWLIKLAVPHYFIHGHVHLYDASQAREQKVGSTSIINVYGHSVVIVEGS